MLLLSQGSKISPSIVIDLLFLKAIFTSVGTTRGQGIIIVIVVVLVLVVAIFWKILKVNKAQILTF